MYGAHTDVDMPQAVWVAFSSRVTPTSRLCVPRGNNKTADANDVELAAGVDGVLYQLRYA